MVMIMTLFGIQLFTGAGTVINALAVAIGGIVGMLVGGFLKERYRETIIKIIGFGTITMAIMGSITEGINGDPSILISKSVIDFIFIITLAASMGKGCIFASIPILIIQGLTTLLATVIAPAMTTAAINNLSLVGNVLIMCVGVNIVWPKTIRVANLLPCIVVAVVFAFV